MLLLSLLFTLSVLPEAARSQAHSPQQQVGIAATCRRPGLVALTFDQGPGVATGRILDVLQRRRLLATFHVTVDFFRNQTLRAYVKRAAAEGHTIGLYVPDYTQSLLPLPLLSNYNTSNSNGNINNRDNRNRDGKSGGEGEEEFVYEHIARASNWLTVLIGRGPQYIRFARKQSHLPVELKRLVVDGLGMMPTRARIEVHDENNRLDNIWASLQRGFNQSTPAEHSFIVRFRDVMPNTAASLERIVDYIEGQNYTIVPMEQCLPLSERLVQQREHRQRAIAASFNLAPLAAPQQLSQQKNVASSLHSSVPIIFPMLLLLILCLH
jgi:peptidoglycan/xylan/chitin deacetylase (PgdA/CDA1 family)